MKKIGFARSGVCKHILYKAQVLYKKHRIQIKQSFKSILRIVITVIIHEFMHRSNINTEWSTFKSSLVKTDIARIFSSKLEEECNFIKTVES